MTRLALIVLPTLALTLAMGVDLRAERRLARNDAVRTMSVAAFEHSLMFPGSTKFQTADWFVATTGSDSNACTTSGSPCLTIDGAEAKAIVAGDIIQVAGGVHVPLADNRQRLTKSGSSGSPIIYRGHDGSGCPTTAQTDRGANIVGITTRTAPTAITARWLIQASYITIDCFDIRPGENRDAFDIDGIDRDGITGINNYFNGRATAPNSAVGCKIAFVADDATDEGTMGIGDYFARNYITGCSIGTGLQGTSFTFELNEIHLLYAISGDMDCMRAWGNVIVFQKNYCHDNLQFNCEDSTGTPPDPQNCHVDFFQSFTTGTGPAHQILKNFVFTRNSCIACGSAALQIHLAPTTAVGPFDGITLTNNLVAHGLSDEADPDEMSWAANLQGTLNTTLDHNTFAFSGPIRCTESAVCTIRNNILYDDDTDGITFSVGATGSESYNLLESTAGTFVAGSCAPNCDATDILNQDPLFTNIATNDYSLQTTSPAKNAGTNAGITVDVTGATRSGVPDIGAFEFVSSAPVRLRLRPS